MPTARRWRWAVGDTIVERVPEPHFDLVLPQAADVAEPLLARAPWLAPHYVSADGGLRIGSSAIVIRSPGACVLVDPWLAFDDPDRTAPAARARLDRQLAALAATGVEPDDVDVVINSHVDGVGANTRPAESTEGAEGAEVATFPRARYVLAAAEVDGLQTGEPASVPRPLVTLCDAGRLEPIEADEQISDEVRVEAAPGHTPGHLTVWVDSGDAHAVIVGHLFLHPAQLLLPDRPDLDQDPALADATRRQVLERAATQRALLVGPLFATPGAGVVVADDDRWRLDPAPPIP